MYITCCINKPTHAFSPALCAAWIYCYLCLIPWVHPSHPSFSHILDLKCPHYHCCTRQVSDKNSTKLEELECLHSEDTPHRPMITHTIDSYWIPSQTKQSYKFQEFAKTSNVWILTKSLHVTHLLQLLDKMCKCEMDPASIVEDTDRTWFCPQTDEQTDRQPENIMPPEPQVGGIKMGGCGGMQVAR